MDANTYQLLADRTASKGELGRDLIPNDKQALFELISLFQAGSGADVTKRSLFYKDPKHTERIAASLNKAKLLYEGVLGLPQDFTMDQQQVDVMHAVLGIMSEGAEIVEELVTSVIEKRPMDSVNMAEEGGDILWYVALKFNALQILMEDAMQKNIDKLRKRYPEKFEGVQALERDLAGERQVLEGNAERISSGE